MLETKRVLLFQKEYINDLTSFGWQPTETMNERHGRTTTHYQILARSTDMRNYAKIKMLEADYESCKSQLKTYFEAEFLTALVCFLFFIIPGIIYLVYKSNQKKEINEHNEALHAKMEQSMKAARSLL